MLLPYDISQINNAEPGKGWIGEYFFGYGGLSIIVKKSTYSVLFQLVETVQYHSTFLGIL